MSKTIDLTGDNSSSDDGISEEDRPKPKRGRTSADLRNAPSILSNSGGGVASLGSRQVSCSAASFATSSRQRKSPSIFSFYGAGVASSGSVTNVANSNEGKIISYVYIIISSHLSDPLSYIPYLYCFSHFTSQKLLVRRRRRCSLSSLQ